MSEFILVPFPAARMTRAVVMKSFSLCVLLRPVLSAEVKGASGSAIKQDCRLQHGAAKNR
ncbi:hypothetical protein [uncultured Ruegeria sp.]|uniref:hypothetical protein n=1 Tax=uncultured Ruegeria sp. TaxID=259304 RepID=UPI0026069D31|nr:hypothetical protein [uncultured Ruegeria sp.]